RVSCLTARQHPVAVRNVTALQVSVLPEGSKASRSSPDNLLIIRRFLLARVRSHATTMVYIERWTNRVSSSCRLTPSMNALAVTPHSAAISRSQPQNGGSSRIEVG